MPKGKVYLIGAGPGDVGLITMKGKHYLESADVVVYDYLASEVFKKYCKDHPDKEYIYVGKKSGKYTLKQNEINQTLVRKAREGKIVARLKGGDPFVFGRGGEEALFLAENKIPFEIIPGVTSAIAVPSYAGIPVTHRGLASQFTVITGHEDLTKSDSKINYQNLSKSDGTIIFLMGVSNLEEIINNLIKYGKNPKTPAAIIQWGTTPSQKSVFGKLNNIAHLSNESKIEPPAILVIGEVVELSKKINWFEEKPLFGKTVTITRSEKQSELLKDLLYENGANVIEFPTIKIETSKNIKEIKNVISKIQEYNWIIFTSVNGVEIFFNHIFEIGKDLRILKNINICSIGAATTEKIKTYYLNVDYQPKEYTSENIVEGLVKCKKRGTDVNRLSHFSKNYLLIQSNLSRDIIAEELSEKGANVTKLIVYNTVINEDIVGARCTCPQITGHMQYAPTKYIIEKSDVITFTSSSTVKNFIQLIGKKNMKKIKDKIKIASIGSITSETIKECGLNVDIEAKEYTTKGLVEAIIMYFKKNRTL